MKYNSFPHIDFSLDFFRKLDADDWRRIGLCEARVETLAHTPLTPDAARRLLRVYLARGVHATTAIEGNTLSESDVEQAIDGELDLPESRRYLRQEVDNVIRACNEIVGTNVSAIDLERVLAWNRMVLDGLELDPNVVPGEIRHHVVGVANYRAPEPSMCRDMMRDMLDWLDRWGREHRGFTHTMLRAIVGHLYIAWIHPFGDGNGRTARLLELAILYAGGVPMPAAHLLSNHYNATRSEYYRRIQESTAQRSPLPFVRYAIHGFADMLREQLEEVRQMLRRIMFRDLVYDCFRDQPGDTAHRRRALALDLLAAGQKVEISRLMGLTTRLADAYRGKTSKTLTRDLNALKKMGLVRVDGATASANLAIVDALMPRRRNAN